MACWCAASCFASIRSSAIRSTKCSDSTSGSLTNLFTWTSPAMTSTISDVKTEVYIDGGQMPTGLHPEDWARQAEARGAGEILLQSINRDGTGEGYDVELIRSIAAATTIPVIACSGVGRYEHYVDGVRAG